VNILDNILYGFPSSFNVFMESNGLEIIVKRIEAEVALCVSVVQTNGSLPFDRGTLLRALLKFIMHMMQTSGSADRMRNLIESSLPKSILIILDNSKGFGANVFGISINIMATFIHNEPNSLNILQEAKIPQAFLNAINSSMPVSAEVISAIPNAFGAICLNSAGLEAFNEANRIETYLQIFTEKENLRTVQDNDVPHLVGNSMDELIRHQPSLKESVISALISMLSKVNELGEFYANENLDKTVLLLSPTDATMKETGIIDQQREEDIVIMIDVVSRLLEGLFQNVAHAQDFIRLGGTEKLQKLSQLACIPYDFTSTPSSFTLSYLFRVLIESDPNRIIEIIVKRTKDMIDLLDGFMQHSENGSMLEKYIHPSAGNLLSIHHL
jgi:E3 ubiquitin-protein ligase HUWE1